MMRLLVASLFVIAAAQEGELPMADMDPHDMLNKDDESLPLHKDKNKESPKEDESSPKEDELPADMPPKEDESPPLHEGNMDPADMPPKEGELPPEVEISPAKNVDGQGTCAVNSAEAVSDALDASLFIWASIERCGKAGEMVKCEIGVSSAIAAVNSMVNVILKAINNCDALNTINKDCAISASDMTKDLAGLAAGSGGLVQKCFQGPKHADNWNPAHRDPAMCAIDVKNGAKNLFKVVKAFLMLDDNCNNENPKACVANGFQIAGAFAGIGSFLAGAIGKCTAVEMPAEAKWAAPTPAPAAPESPCATQAPAAGGRRLIGEAGEEYPAIFCVQQAQRLVQKFSEFSARAIQTSEKCAPKAPPPPPAPVEEPAPPVDESVVETSRLYSKQGKMQFNGGSVNFILAAFLPVTAIVGFVGGRIFGSHRTTRSTRETYAYISNE